MAVGTGKSAMSNSKPPNASAAHPTASNHTKATTTTRKPTHPNQKPQPTPPSQNPAPPSSTSTQNTAAPVPNGTSASWSQKVRVTNSNTRFTLDPLPQRELGSILQVSEDMMLENAHQWKCCLIGFFPGYNMPYLAVKSIALRVWSEFGLETVTSTANGFVVFRFKAEQGLLRVMERGPWMFGGKTIVLQQWHPHFVFDKNKISKLPVWVRLQGLPFPLWSRKGLSLAASMVGRPLSCDEATFKCERLEYARLCVELDASLPLVHQFQIESPLSDEPIRVDVDYEWKPKRCSKCKVFGHNCVTAPTSSTPAVEEVIVVQAADPSLGANAPGAPINVVEATNGVDALVVSPAASPTQTSLPTIPSAVEKDEEESEEGDEEEYEEGSEEGSEEESEEGSEERSEDGSEEESEEGTEEALEREPEQEPEEESKEEISVVRYSADFPPLKRGQHDSIMVPLCEVSRQASLPRSSPEPSASPLQLSPQDFFHYPPPNRPHGRKNRRGRGPRGR